MPVAGGPEVRAILARMLTEVAEPTTEPAEPAGLAHRAMDVVRSWRPAAVALVAISFVVAVVLAYRGRPSVLYDDAAITLRYARRIVDGHGWTYNDLDRTNGASAPLFTLVVAAMHAIGIDLTTAARAVNTACYGAAVALAAYLAERISGWVAAIVAAVVLLTWTDFLYQSMSGMESSMAAALGLAAILALRSERDGLAGFFVALALINKLDAGMLALAIAAAYLLVMRRPPWRVMGYAIVTFSPWLVFSTAYFGSVLPYSFTQKAAGEVDNPAANLTSDWILKSLEAQGVMVLVGLGLAAGLVVPFVVRRDRRAGLALLTCIIWPVAHGLVFSVVKLGDRYPWYLTVLYPPLAVAGACLIGFVIDLVPGWTKVLAAAAAVVLLALGMGFTDRTGGRIAATADTLADGRPYDEYESVEGARRAAAKHLESIAAPGDVIATCFGWFAFEAPDHQILETCPLNTRKPVGNPRWGTLYTVPATAPAPVLPPDVEIVATFYSDVQPGARIDIVRYPCC